MKQVYINNSLHLARKYARIFVLGHYLFREAHSFPRATLSENCSLLGTDNVQGQISEHIFAPNGDYCVYYPSNLFRNTRSFENSGIFNNYLPKWRWIVVDIYRAAKHFHRLSPTLRWIIVLVHILYHTSWITSGPKRNFICLRVTLFETGSHFVFLRLRGGE